MAQLVKKAELSDQEHPGLVAVHRYKEPFTEEEIKKLTKGLSKYALVTDGEHLFIYGE